MQNITLEVGNNSQNILPVPYLKNPVPSVESPMNYGSSPYPAFTKQISRKDDNLQYCNFLEPSPRDQRLNVPYEGNKYCPKFKTQPYNKDSCYLMDSKSQGVTGIVCNESGGSDNSNFYRGNQFSTDYPFNFNEIMNDKKIEYTVENPVQIPMELQNPMIIYNNSDFYPTPSFKLSENKNYLTYPLQKNFSEDGYPIYTYPYKTLNSIETFENNTNNKKHFFFILFIFFSILLFLYFFRN